VLATLSSVSVGSASGAVIRTFDVNGRLTNASGVIVGGQSYDVEFYALPCEVALGTCGPAFDVFFTTEQEAVAASAALLLDVLIDVPGHALDTNPMLLPGCTVGTYCDVYTAFDNGGGNDAYLRTAVAMNFAAEGDPSAFALTFLTPGHWISVGPVSATRWSPTPQASVPEPSTLTLLALGAAAARLRRRR
jgi:hypothetical protein